MTKYCKNCGNAVEDSSKFCPHCKSESFTYKNELMVPESDLIHKIFYWPFPGGHVLSKSKLMAISMSLYLLLLWIFTGNNAFSFVLALIVGLIIFLIGLVIHKFKPAPSPARIRHNDYGLVRDIINLLFYWQDRNGNYVLSKTKIISLLVFIVVFTMGITAFKVAGIFPAILLGVLVEIPVFVIGFAIHKLTSKDLPEQKLPKKAVKEVKKVEEIEQPITSQKNWVIPQYLDYQIQLDRLNSKFKSKEKTARNLIEKRFEPPQITYTRFISGVDKSAELFKKSSDSAFTMINLADEYSSRIAGEIEKKIGIMEAIIEKLDDLSNELIVNNDLSKKEDVDNLIIDMDDLIDSVKDYE